MIPKTTIAYVAGYTDGDGCFHIMKNLHPSGNVKYRPTFIISSVNPKITDFLANRFNGQSKLADKRVKFPSQKPQFHFYLGGKKCLPFVQLITPFLVEKREEAETFCSFIKSSTKDQKEAFKIKIGILKNNTGLVFRRQKEILLRESLSIDPSKEDFAYFAGFIDAECCFSLNRYIRKGTNLLIYKPILRCNNTKIATIQWMVQRFGGQLCFRDLKRKNPKHRDQMMWTLSSRSLAKIIPKIFPYLKFKKPVCKEFMKFFETIQVNGDRHSENFRISYSTTLMVRDQIFHKVRLLNRKGI